MATLTFTKYYGDQFHFAKLRAAVTGADVDADVFVVKDMDDPMEIGSVVPYLMAVASRVDMAEYGNSPGVPYDIYRTSDITLTVEHENALDDLIDAITLDVAINVETIQGKPLEVLREIYIPGIWTPADLSGLLAWLDASNESTITDVAGAVSQWDDLSGNDNHLVQATGSQQPETGSETLGGLNVLTFDGAFDRMTMTQPDLPKAHTIFMLTEQDVQAGTRYLLANGGSLFDNYIRWAKDDGDFRTNYATGGVWNDSDTNTPAASVESGPALLAIVNDGTTAVPYVNAVAQDAKDGTMDRFPTTDLVIGGWKSLGSAAGGKYAEILIVSGELSTRERQFVEGYLAHKWSVAASILPAGHPYKDNPPFS